MSSHSHLEAMIQRAKQTLEARKKTFYQKHSHVGEVEEIKRGLEQRLKVESPEILEGLMVLGFTHDTVGILPFIPFIQVAWADGEVSTTEARRILDFAIAQGMVKDTPAYRLLEELLHQKSTDDFIDACLYLLNQWYHLLPEEESHRARKSLLDFALLVAEASGGVLGLFGNRVSEEERALLEEFAEFFGEYPPHHTGRIHHSLITKAIIRDE